MRERHERVARGKVRLNGGAVGVRGQTFHVDALGVYARLSTQERSVRSVRSASLRTLEEQDHRLHLTMIEAALATYKQSRLFGKSMRDMYAPMRRRARHR